MIKITIAYQEIINSADLSSESALCPADLQGIYEAGEGLAEPIVSSMIFDDWNKAVNYYMRVNETQFEGYPNGFITVTMDDDGKISEKIFEVGKQQ